jgi:hypothetical protein
MATASQIFFNSGKGTQETVTEVERLLCVSFTREEEAGLVYYTHASLTLELILLDDHGMDEDDVDFETKKPLRYTKYKYKLKFISLYRSGDYFAEVRQTMAHYAYYLMTTRLSYEALLVEDLLTFVAESPDPSA